jgi:hypothetical protein
MRYKIVSAGSDGYFSTDLGSASSPPEAMTRDFDADIVFAEGRFIRYPFDRKGR